MPVRAVALSVALAVTGAVAGPSPPTWPLPIKAVWPTQWASLNYTLDFPFGPAPFDKVTIVGSWYFDWPSNKWRQDTCTAGMGPTTKCKVQLWDGNNRDEGGSAVGKTFVWADGKCTYTASMVGAITHPDSFVAAERTNRSLVDGKWGDTWVADTASWIHYNFSTTMDIRTGKPLMDCGPIMVKPPYALACTRHHNPKFAAEMYSDAEWAAFFALDTSKCTPKTKMVDASAEMLPPSVWPGALLSHPQTLASSSVLV